MLRNCVPGFTWSGVWLYISAKRSLAITMRCSTSNIAKPWDIFASAASNVLFWLERHGVPPTDEVVEKIYQRAKASDHTLTEPEIRECIGGTSHQSSANRELRTGLMSVPNSCNLHALMYRSAYYFGYPI